jgi:hypothetical protein
MSRSTAIATLVTAAATLLLPATSSADALVSNQGHGLNCAFFVAGKAYSGSGTEVITPTGQGILQCHLSLVSGDPVERPTTTTIGNCELLEVPSGQAHASCRFQL